MSVYYDVTDKEQLITDLINQYKNRFFTTFDYAGLPESAPALFFDKQLMETGHIAVFKYRGEIITISGTFAGVPDIYGEPNNYLAVNAALGSHVLTIHKKSPIVKGISATLEGEPCVLIRNNPLMTSLEDDLRRVCTLLCENIITENMINILTRAPFILTASNNATRQSAELFMKKLFDGKLGIIEDKQFVPDDVKTLRTEVSLTNPYLEYHQFWKSQGYTDIGVQSVYNKKSQYVSKEEMTMADETLYTILDCMLRCRQEGWDMCNELFGTNVKVRLNPEREKEVVKDEDVKEEKTDEVLQLQESQDNESEQ